MSKPAAKPATKPARAPRKSRAQPVAAPVVSAPIAPVDNGIVALNSGRVTILDRQALVDVAEAW